jgi:hypothetical protein
VIGYDYGNLWEWEEFDPSRLLEIMSSFEAPWWIAGGWALDLWMGRETRTHQDLDVAILRRDQLELYRALHGWELYYATSDHRLLPLQTNQWLRSPIHGVWTRRAHDAPWLCEFLLNEHEGTDWVYREDPAVRMPLANVGIVVSGNIPILVPEVVLLYKAHERTEKDEADFQAALPRLTSPAKSWLLHAVNESLPNHPWAARLRSHER